MRNLFFHGLLSMHVDVKIQNEMKKRFKNESVRWAYLPTLQIPDPSNYSLAETAWGALPSFNGSSLKTS